MRETLLDKGKREKLPRNARGERLRRPTAGSEAGQRLKLHDLLLATRRTPNCTSKVNKKRNSQDGGKGDSAVRKVSTLHVGLSPVVVVVVVRACVRNPDLSPRK